jgi:hypothetical protein
MSLVGFEPTISAGGRPQTYALDRAATGTGKQLPPSDAEVKSEWLRSFNPPPLHTSP